jgi:alpha-beta hydrolase superfamily lysophospholipase
VIRQSCCVVGLCALATIGSRAAETVAPAALIAALRADMPPLREPAATATPALDAFQRYYGLPVSGCARKGGFIEVDHARIFVQTFRPAQPKGGVLVVHGYYDHAGVLAALIRMLVSANYAVLVYDQPGHGLSDGARADIDSFTRYVTVLRAVLDLLPTELPAPRRLVAHSLGCAPVLDYLAATTTTPFERVVFVAPLIRSAAWHWTKIGNPLAHRVTDSLPRNFRRNSSDQAFLAAVQADPLQARRVPLGWVEQLKIWNRRVAALPPTPHAIWVLQGTRDTTLDWKYNVRRLRKLFPKGCTVSLWPGGGHQLMNEAEPMRSQVLQTIREILDRADVPVRK